MSRSTGRVWKGETSAALRSFHVPAGGVHTPEPRENKDSSGRLTASERARPAPGEEPGQPSSAFLCPWGGSLGPSRARAAVRDFCLALPPSWVSSTRSSLSRHVASSAPSQPLASSLCRGHASPFLPRGPGGVLRTLSCSPPDPPSRPSGVVTRSEGLRAPLPS